MAGEVETAAAAAKQLHDETLATLPAGSHDEAACVFCTPRTEQAGDAMSGDAKLTEDEKVEVLATEKAARATADLTARAEKAEAELATLKADHDKTLAEKAAAETKLGEVTAEFETFKTGVEQANEISSRKEARLAEVREVASFLADDYFTEERVTGFAKMTDEEFAAKKAELAGIAEAAGIKPGTQPPPRPPAEPPRETAMAGGAQAGHTETRSASSRLISGVGIAGRRNA